MAPRKKKVTVEATDPELRKVLEDFGTVEVNELPPDVDNVLKEIGEDVTKVLLYRRLKGEKQAYVGTVEADEFSLDETARRWGGGRYLARLVGPEGIMKGVTFYIDESIKPQPKDALMTPGSDLNNRLLEKLLDNAIGGGNRQPSVDPAAIAAAIATAASSQLAAMMGAMAPLLGKITELASGGGKPGSPTSDLFEAINLGLSLGGKDDGIMGAVERVGVPLVKIAGDALAMQAAKRGTRRNPAPNPPTGTEGAAVASPGLPAGVPAWVQLVRGFVPTIVEFAARNEDPEILAIGLEQQQPRVADWLDKKVTEPDFEPTLLGAFPALEVHREWVHRFLAEFGPDVEEEPEEITHEEEGGA